MKQYAKICACNKLKSLSYEDKGLIRRERRDGGERERIEKGSRERNEIERKETKGN